MRYLLRCLLLIGCSLLSLQALAQEQTGLLQGTVSDSTGAGILGANVLLPQLGLVLATDSAGRFEVRLPSGNSYSIRLRHVQYQALEVQSPVIQAGVLNTMQMQLQTAITVLDQVEIQGVQAASAVQNQVSTVRLEAIAARNLPSAFGEFNKILATLPGVASNNELSATYSVRGGSFDENLIYVNGMPIYRPFLIRAGQQEGLSFVNPDLVDDITFSAGGWQPKYGDKLSSVLNITYKRPTELAGSATLGLLGGTAHLENASANGKVNYMIGARHKTSRYLLNTLETQGQYLPRFTDLQLMVNINLSEDSIGGKPVSQLAVIGSYARNRYLVEPELRETRFGTINRVFRLVVDFAGRELLEYDTWQGGLQWSRRWNGILQSDFIVSGLVTREREFFEVEGGYLLCDVNTNPGSDRFNQCVVERGVGSTYDYGRNSLEATLLNAEIRNSLDWNTFNRLEFGLGLTVQDVQDLVSEFEFTDSADFVTIDRQVDNEIELQTYTVSGYVQNTTSLPNGKVLTFGSRVSYWEFGNQWLISPRLQYSFETRNWAKPIRVKMATGLYRQAPFYRELRDPEGNLQEDVRAQSSFHTIVGVDYDFKAWGRPFVLSSELYYKHLYDVIPYDIDNVRLRYFAENNAVAYAAGLDFRINGEFIPGTQSWFSVGVLSTREDVEGDNQGYIRRPTDQRLNVGIYFEDHFPNDPSLRVNLGFFYGSGLPFSPPDNPDFRASFNGDPYERVDLGFAKVILYDPESKAFFKSLRIGLDVLNLLGADNPISYTWIKDVNNTQFAVPNSLSARFVNLKVRADF